MLLAIDTSTAQVGIALLNEGQLMVESIWHSRVHHTIELAPAVAQLLQRAGSRPAAIRAIVVAIGPGSFTALRVGLAFAKGLALAVQAPIVGVPTLDILAAGQPTSELPLAAVLQAGRGRIAVHWYKCTARTEKDGAADGGEPEAGWVPVGNAQVATVDLLAKSITKTSLVAGELTAEDRLRLARKRARIVVAPMHRCVRRPSILAEIGWRRYTSARVDDIASLAPLYLHVGDPLLA